ncbi:hypothetical protein M1307_03435 [Patescibacteria group bacterium]|nr:hypothetical protein [Patescibacteria group bacterium]
MDNNSKQYKIILLGVVILTIVFFVLGFTLDKLRGGKKTEAPVQTSAPTAAPSAPKIISCPVAKELCQKAVILEFVLPNGGKKYDGLGFLLPANSAIRAPFDGTFKEQETHGGTNSPRLITITSSNGKYEARYFFTPASPLSVTEERIFGNGIEVKNQDVLSFVPGKPLRSYKENLQFFVIDKKTGKTLQLKPEDLGKLVLD